MQGGTLLSLQNTAVAATSTGKVLSIGDTTTGAGYGIYSLMTGQGNTGYAGYFTNTSTTGANYGLYASTSSSSGYAGYFTNTGTGYALYANGPATLSSTTTVSGALNATATVNLKAAINATGLASGTVVSGSYLGLNSSNQVVLGSGGSGGTALSSITSATGTNSIDSTNNAQTWAWGTLSTQTALTLTTSSMQGGTLLSLQDTAVAATSTGKVLSIGDATTGAGYGIYSSMTGHGNTGYAGYFANTDTGADANYGIYASNASTGAGYGGYFTSTSYYGVYSTSSNINGVGVWGNAAATTGTTYGLYGTTTSTGGIGSGGYNYAVTGTTYGVLGFDQSTSGYGGYFTNAGSAAAAPAATGTSYFNGYVGIGTTTPTANLQIGSLTSASTATPATIDLGGTYSNTAGVNPKLKLYDDGGGSPYGIGISSGETDYMVPSLSKQVFWIGATQAMTITSTGSVGIATAVPVARTHHSRKRSDAWKYYQTRSPKHQWDFQKGRILSVST